MIYCIKTVKRFDQTDPTNPPKGEMNIMKRWTFVLAGLLAVFCLAACGAEPQEPVQKTEEPPAETTTEPRQEESKPAPQEKPEEKSKEEPQEEPKDDDMARYEEVLDMYRANIADGWSLAGTDSFDPSSASELFWQGGSYSVSDVGYTLIDLDQDHTPELILSFLEENEESGQGLIADLYTIRNDKVIHVISTWAKARYQLAADHTINYIGSSSSFDAQVYNFRLPPQEEVLKLNFGFSWTSDPESYGDTAGKHYYSRPKDSVVRGIAVYDEYSAGSTYDYEGEDQKQEISKKEANEIDNRMPENQSLDLTPLG